jgi:DNA-binding NarL/FixJ family response regulator
MKPIRIVLADDHLLLREGIRSLLKQLAGIEVVAEANDGREALKMIKIHQPDILMTDIGMKGMNGLEAATRAAAEAPHVRVLSMHAHEEYVAQALKAGVAAYVLKDSEVQNLN